MSRYLQFFLLVSLAIGHSIARAEQQGAAGTIGVNKYDLFAQYNGTASGGDGGPAYRRVTRAMAKKAIADAADIGVRYMRVSMSGRTSAEAGKDSLDLWRSQPQRFWRDVDDMMDDLDVHAMQIVPVLAWGSGKFPLMAGEPLGEMLRDPKSESWKLLERFVTEFVTRYRGRRTVLFYELTNELNNYADLDMVRRCSKKKAACEERERFTADDMIAYTTRLAALLHRLDDTRLVSSGFSIPRASAEHLRANPEWTVRKTDWRKDTRQQLTMNLKDIHSGVDIISIHLYGGKNNWRFGSTDAVDLLAVAKQAADEAGKPLFVGEFGDTEPGEAREDGHAIRMMEKLVELKVPYSAIWVWEFYQENTYSTHDTRHTVLSLEPGYTDAMIDRLRVINGGKARPGRDVSPPRVVLTWPLECSTPDTLHAVASDDSGRVQRVEFWMDGNRIASDDTPPYQANIPAGQIAAGKHRLTAKAYDVAGNAAEYSTAVIVGNGIPCSVNTK